LSVWASNSFSWRTCF